MAILIDSEKIIRVFPNVSNQIRFQKKRLQTLNPSGNSMMSIQGNSYTNLNALQPYNSAVNSINLNNNSMANQIDRSLTSNVNSYQTEDIFAML